MNLLTVKVEKLRGTLSNEARITFHQQYKARELSGDAAEILLGDALEKIDREWETLEVAADIDTINVLQE